MKLNTIHESDNLPHNTRVWTPEEHQGAKHKKHWYQKYYVKAKPYTWPKKTGGKEATGYKEHILPPGTVKEDVLRETEDEQRMTEKWANELANTYINPDQLYQSDSEFDTFIYTKDGQIYSFPHDHEEEPNHINIIGLNDDLYSRYQKLLKIDDVEKMRKRAIDIDLLGRVGTRRLGMYDRVRIASFWNYSESSLALLPDCLKDIKSRGWIDDDSFVSTPNHKTVPVNTIIGGTAETKEMTDDEQTDYDLYSKLHQLRGQEKHDAMKKLGVGVGGRPHPMQQAMTKAGLIGPGQKWWAMHSEEKQKMPYHIKKSGNGYKVFSPNGPKSKKPLSKKKAEAQQAAIYANTHGEDVAVALDKLIGEETVTLQMDCETYNDVIGLLASGHTLENIIENKMGITGWKGTMMLSQLIMTH